MRKEKKKKIILKKQAEMKSVRVALEKNLNIVMEIYKIKSV